MANTGYKGYSTLLKVDSLDRPLDINNNLCSESGLSQDTKPNTIGDPDYVAPVLDTTACPLPITSTAYPFSETPDTNPSVACTFNADDDTLYSADAVLTIGSILYTDALLTIPKDGLGWSWHTGGLPGKTYVISNVGVIISTANCV
jgi:hypothetical protein